MDRPPDSLRCCRHGEVADAEWRQRIVDGIHHDGKCADRTAFAGALDAQRIGRRWHGMAVEIEEAKIIGCGMQ